MKSYTAVACAGFAFAVHTTTGLAQAAAAVTTAPGSTDQTRPSDGGLEEVVVTALKQTQSLEKAAAQISVIGAAELESQQITTIRGLGQYLPSAQFAEQGAQTKVFVRGVGTFISEDQLDSAVPVYIDSIYVPRPASWASFFDLDNASVLAGPQGTLYGRNSVGGAVLLTTKAPGDSYGGNGLIEAGNYGLVHTAVGVDIPLADVLHVRIATDFNKNNGYLSDGVDSQDTKAVRLTARYTPTDALSVKLSGEYNQDNGLLFGTLNIPSFNPKDPYYFPVNPHVPGYYSDNTVSKAAADVEYALDDGLKLTYLPSYYYYNIDTYGPAVAQNDLQKYSGKQFTNELRLSGDIGRWNFIAGAYQFWADPHFTANVFQGNYGAYDPSNFASLYVPPYTLDVTLGPQSSTNRSYAGFGQVIYSLTNALRLTAGLRYTTDSRDATVTGIGIGLPLGTAPGGAPIVIPPAGFSGKRNYNNTSYKVGVDYDLTARSLLYATVQTSYLPGGYQDSAQSVASYDWFQPETITAYTVGSKNRFLDNALQLNFEGFYYRYKNFQVSDFNLYTDSTNFFNAQTATIYGSDFDVRYQLTRVDQLTVSLGLLSAHYTEFVLPGGLVNYNGNQMVLAPAVSATLGFQHIWDLANGGNFNAAVNSHIETAQWGTQSHAEGTRIGSYTKSNASITYNAPGDHWNVALWVKNFENTYHYSVTAVGGPPGPAAGTIEPPRTFGARLGFTF